MSDRLSTTAKNHQNLDSTFKVSPFRSRSFEVQTKLAESTLVSKAQLWENYQQTKQLNQKGSNISAVTTLPIQAKLTILQRRGSANGQPGDKYEQEADSVAAMSAPAQVQREELLEEEEELQMKPLAGTISPQVQREELPEEEELQMKSVDNSIQREELPAEEELQMKQSVPSTQTATPDLESQLGSSKGSGSPLSDDVRSFMEPRFGADFSGVRVHTGSDAVQMNQGVNAQAFAHGQDIYFGAGKSPGKDALTAHELTHVVQQTGEIRTKLSNHVDGISQSIQRTGWSDATKGGVNASESAVGGIRRIPIEGLMLGNKEPMKLYTNESADGKAIVLIPQTLGQNPNPGQVEVLLHLHGYSNQNHSGYRQNKNAATVRDIALDKIEQQLDASGRTKMIGILPQGGNHSEFGKSGLDIDKYISEVLVKIQPLTTWSILPTTRVVMSAHSGGGGRIGEMLAGQKGKLPASMGELVLFDAINGPGELSSVSGWILQQISSDLSNLAGKSVADQLTYLERSIRFRGYYTVGYQVRYRLLAKHLSERFKKPDVAALPSAVASKLQDNYQVKSAGHRNHDAIVGGAKDAKGKSLGLADPLKDALSALQPKRLDRPDLQRRSLPAINQSTSPIIQGKTENAHNVTDVAQPKRNNYSIEKIIMPYRPSNKTHFNADREGDLQEDNFNSKKDKKTKPWIKEIVIDFAMEKNDDNGNLIPIGTATAYYEQNESALPPTTVGITGGSSGKGLGLTRPGKFTVTRIEGVGYNDVPLPDGEGPNKKYSKSDSSSMHYAVFFDGGRALHGGSLSDSSHGCVHAEVDSYLKQINYHSIVGLTKVTVNFASGLQKDIKSGKSSHSERTQLISNYEKMLESKEYKKAVNLLLTLSEHDRQMILKTSSIRNKYYTYINVVKNTSMDRFDSIGNETRSAYLGVEYSRALGTKNWQMAAEFLNGFNKEDIQLRLIRLNSQDRLLLHNGAVNNKKVGAAAQVAQMTKPA
jgi:Domain of unknown function (DUF4157)